VRETLMFAARLRLGPGPLSKKADAVTAVIADLGRDLHLLQSV